MYHLSCLGAYCLATGILSAAEIGVFQASQDIGSVRHRGIAQYTPQTQTYRIAGGGENMWFTNDAFHFAYQRISGDFSMESAIQWLKPGGNAHRKACLVARQNLTPGSPYIDVAVHGDGLTSLQYREVQDGPTREIQCSARNPVLLALERQSNTFFLSISLAPGTPITPSGAGMRLPLSDALYVGLGVCAHDNQALEEALFSQVKISAKPSREATPKLLSTLETVALASRDRRVVHTAAGHFEAPNWAPDVNHLIYNSTGRLYRIPLAGGQPVRLDTGFATRCNNDHGLSPDGKWLAISDQSKDGKSRIYVVPAVGGEPRLVTPLGPSYWHGWSPDGATLVYCAERDGEYDVYAIPVSSGDERRLTTAKGLDDGPEYSPDGKFIYFNSDRTGLMQIWRMKPDGTGQEQITSDQYNNWFAHPSPDGKWIVFLSYETDVRGHPANHSVTLRLMPAAGGPIQDLARLFGGQGTINVPSWSPDSRSLAFVSYEFLHLR
jgi:Tol biopolymer transport system component